MDDQPKPFSAGSVFMGVMDADQVREVNLWMSQMVILEERVRSAESHALYAEEKLEEARQLVQAYQMSNAARPTMPPDLEELNNAINEALLRAKRKPSCWSDERAGVVSILDKVLCKRELDLDRT